MLHAHEKFNRIQDPENKIPKDEPVFLLRAQDELAIHTMEQYIFMRRLKYGMDDDIATVLSAHATRMFNWPKKKKAD